MEPAASWQLFVRREATAEISPILLTLVAHSVLLHPPEICSLDIAGELCGRNRRLHRDLRHKLAHTLPDGSENAVLPEGLAADALPV